MDDAESVFQIIIEQTKHFYESDHIIDLYKLFD